MLINNSIFLNNYAFYNEDFESGCVFYLKTPKNILILHSIFFVLFWIKKIKIFYRTIHLIHQTIPFKK